MYLAPLTSMVTFAEVNSACPQQDTEILQPDPERSPGIDPPLEEAWMLLRTLSTGAGQMLES